MKYSLSLRMLDQTQEVSCVNIVMLILTTREVAVAGPRPGVQIHRPISSGE